MSFTAGQRLTASALNSAFALTPTLIQSTILSSSASQITITIPAGYNHLTGVFSVRQDSTSGGAFCLMRLNGDSGNNYTFQSFYGHATTATTSNSGATSSVNIGVTPGPADTANYFGDGQFAIGNIASSVFKPISSYWQCATSVTNAYAGTGGGLWLSTAAVTSVTLLPSSGNLVAGSSMSIYGLG